MPRETRRKTPEELLRDVQVEESAVTNGKLKIFLGYASGVGKSFRMLDEARRRRGRGQDVVVGAVQSDVPGEVRDLLKNLEVIPLKSNGDESRMDVEALLLRHPAVCVVDGLAYDNPPGTRNATRWQDVEELLKSGISVIASINIQYVAELRAQIEAVTGKTVSQTVPISVVKSADEIEIVDAPPEDQTEGVHENGKNASSRQHKLATLRELALLLAATVIDHQLSAYLNSHGIDQTFGAHERILVCITPRTNVQEMVEVGRMIADRFHGELIAAVVKQPGISVANEKMLDDKLQLARNAGACIETLEGDDPVEAILAFARSHGVTQLFIGHTQRAGLWSRVRGNPVDQLIEGSCGIDVRVFPQ